MPYDAAPGRQAEPTKALLISLGYSPSTDGNAADFLHDRAFNCSNCGLWCAESDRADDDDPWAEAPSECRWCRWNLVREVGS